MTRIKTQLTVRLLLVAGCLLCAAAAVFPQVSAKSPKPSPKRKRATSIQSASKIGHRTYVVKKGDSLYSIATTHGTTPTALKTLNQMRTTRLSIGQKLNLPGSLATSASLEKEAARVAQASQAPSPVVAHGDPETAFPDEAAPVGPMLAILNPAVTPDELAAQPLRYRLASVGLEFLGVRYRRSGESETSGFDCSGLVKTLFDKFQISLPRTSREQYRVGEKVAKDDLEVGDLVFFSSRGKTPSHVGIYLGDSYFLHAAIKAKRVLVSSLTQPWYMKRFLGARRLQDLWKDAPKAEEPKSNTDEPKS